MRLLPLLAAAVLLAGARMGAAPAPPPAPPPDTTIDCDGQGVMSSTDTESTTVFNDNVVVVGNGIRLTCDYLKVVSTRIGDKTATIGKYGNFKYMLATGRVKIVQGDRIATCGRAEVFPGEDRVVLTENPVVELVTEHDIASGPRMVLYRGQRRAIIEGTPTQKVHITMPAIKDLGFPAAAPAPAPGK
jgi:lipopolysaccharide export system protein LptA